VSVAVGDFNGDSDPDLAVANEVSDNVSVLLGDGSGGFGAASNFGVGDGPRSVAVGDFNGDSDPDLAVANFDSDNVSVLLGDGSTPLRAVTSNSRSGRRLKPSTSRSAATRSSSPTRTSS
jgi:predicted nucleotidyltransferase